VGAIGGLGGFVLPLAFGVMNDLVDVWTSCFTLLFGLASVTLLWMHFAIRRQELSSAPQLEQFRFLPELHGDEGAIEPTAQRSAPRMDAPAHPAPLPRGKDESRQ
jgi:NNP family nitrate/nitrite transporter-like MFS transporter